MKTRLYQKEIFLRFEEIFKRKFKKTLSSYLSSFNAPFFLRDIINKGGNKFRSALSYLLAEKKKEGIIIGSVAEIAWAGIIILDDIGDFSEVRRGGLTPWKKYGLLKSSHAALMAFQIAEFILQENKLYASLDLLRKNTYKTLNAQIEQADFNIFTPSNRILNNYLWKTSLGRWGIETIIQKNNSLSQKEKTALLVFNQLIAVAAQIKNDLDDFEEREYEDSFKDIYSKTINYPLALFFERAAEKDISHFIKKYWGRKNFKKREIKEIKKTIEKYNEFSLSKERIKILLEEALKCLKNVKKRRFRKIFFEWIKVFD